MTRQRISDWEETSLAAFMEERVERSRKRGRKRLPKDNCVLPRSAEHLIRRIVKAAADGSETWAEANREVAGAVHVDRSTVVRMVRRMCEVGILAPVETKGGRGRVSVYRVDRSLAEEALRLRRWPVDTPNRRVEEAQEEGHKAGQLGKPAHRTPLFRQGECPDAEAPTGGVQDLHLKSYGAHGAYSPLGGVDLSRTVKVGGVFGANAAPLCASGIRRWWEAQPDPVRRAVTAASVEALLVAAAGLLGGWKAAMVAALLGTPIAVAYALPQNTEERPEAPVQPEQPPPREAVEPAHRSPLFL